MSAKGIVQSVIEEVKSVLAKAEGVLSGEVTAERAEAVGRALTEAVSAGWVAGFRSWLEEQDFEEETIQREGTTYRYKLDSEKEFLTPGGLMRVRRRVYQPDAGGKCFIPLDAAWGMEGEFATVEVRDAVLFSVALSTPKETETLLKKCALFHPSENRWSTHPHAPNIRQIRPLGRHVAEIQGHPTSTLPQRRYVEPRLHPKFRAGPLVRFTHSTRSSAPRESA